ncbi:betaine/proline/choline family ABC transporter ATP-binding protein [soil metagenome]
MGIRMIEVQHLTKRYDNTVAVNDVSFTILEGQTLVLLGTSGSGKTTTLRMINRLIEPTAGTVTINGINILAQPPEELRRSIGYVLQGYGLLPHNTVAENIAIVPKLLKWDKQKIENRVNELLHKLQLPAGQYRSVYPSNLSGGQMQRVGLARALAANPPILLMDEPFGALDPLTKISVRKEFKQLDEIRKKTIVLVTHDVQEAFELGDTIGLMDKGELVQLGTPIQLLLNPVNDFVENFFQHQRLQLEWQSLFLKDIWNDLPDFTSSAPADLNSNQTGWEAMEMLVNKGRDVSVLDEKTGKMKKIAFVHLQSAIQKLKQQA